MTTNVSIFDREAIRSKMRETRARAQAIIALAKKEERDPTDTELNEFNALMEEIGTPPGSEEPVSGLYADLERAEKLERQAAILGGIDREDRAANGLSLDTAIVDVRNIDEHRSRNELFIANQWNCNTPKAFRGRGNEERAFAEAFDAGMWFLAFLAPDRFPEAVDYCQIVNQQTGTDPDKGSALVPKPLGATIQDVMERWGVARATARIINMSSLTQDEPKRKGGLTVDYGAQATDITESEAEWEQVPLVAATRRTLTKVARELQADAIVNVIDNLAMEIGRAFGTNQDREYINGDGTAGFGNVTGLLSALGTAGQSASGGAWSAVTLDNITDLIGLLPDKYHNEFTGFICSRGFFATVMQKLLYSAGGNTVDTVQSPFVGQRSMVGSFMGYPVWTTDQMQLTAGAGTPLLFGDFYDSAMLGNRQDTEVATSQDYYFGSNSIAVRGITRYDINVHEGGDAGTVGGYVGMTTTV